jgi:hypothetical protein
MTQTSIKPAEGLYIGASQVGPNQTSKQLAVVKKTMVKLLVMTNAIAGAANQTRTEPRLHETRTAPS